MVLECEGIRVSTHSLPKVPKVLAILAANRMNEERVDSKKASLRRILVVTANSGVMVDLVAGLGLQIDSHILSSRCFDRVTLNWEVSSNSEIDSNLFMLPKEGFKNLLRSSNEATLGGMFWTAALNAALLPGCASRSLRLVQEWKTERLLPRFHRRRVDYAALVNCFPIDTGSREKDFYPLLLVEYSRETVPGSNVHKDFGKSGCLAAACCLRLAQRLVELKRRPELARTYCLLVGGTGARLLIANPVIRQVGDEFEIHINVSFSPDWQINLLPTGGDVIARTDTAVPVESIVSASTNPDWDGFDVDAYAGGLVSVEVERVGNVENVLIAESDAMFAAGVGESGLSQIKYIGRLVCERADLLCADDERTRDVLERTFRQVPKSGFLPSARADFATETPIKSQVRSITVSDSPSRRAKVRKTSSDVELQVYREASVFVPGFLPRVYEITGSLGNGMVEYTMELMEPFASEYSGLHSCFVASGGAKDMLYVASKFMLDCLFQLHLFHEQLGLVHADISPANIMYSTIDHIWKLIDFDHAMPRSQSELTSRTAGTPDYTAPEALESRIFTVACDVWSLGEIAMNWILSPLTFGVYCAEDDSESDSETEHGGTEEWVQVLCDSVANCFARMVSKRPADRPTVIEAIKLFYSVICKLGLELDESDLVISGTRSLMRLMDSITPPVVEASSSRSLSAAAKRIEPSSVSEKDPLEIQPPGIEHFKKLKN